MKKLILLAIMISISLQATADVRIKYKSNAEMANIVSLQMDGVEFIKGDKSHSALTTSMGGGMMAMMGNKSPKETIDIVRLDKGLFWELNPAKKTYKETTMESLKRGLSQEEKDADNDKETDNHEWIIEVVSLQKDQIINGFSCNGYMAKAVGIKRDTPGDTIFITNEQWLTSAIAGDSEVKAYQARYAEVAGVSQMWAQENMASMLKGYGPQFEILADSLKRYDGFPIKTMISIESSADEKGKMSDEDMEGIPEMMKNMLKGDDSGKSGRAIVFSMTNEVIEIEQKSIDDSLFEIPAGYIKK